MNSVSEIEKFNKRGTAFHLSFAIVISVKDQLLRSFSIITVH